MKDASGPRRTRKRRAPETGQRARRSSLGRPTKYTPAVRRAILAALEIGATRTAAAAAAGLNRNTLADWMAIYPEFAADVERAEAEAEIMHTTTIADAARGTGGMTRDWRSSETWLKRRRRADYGDSIDVRQMSDEQILRALAAARAVSGDAITEDGLPAIVSGGHVSGADDI